MPVFSVRAVISALMLLVSVSLSGAGSGGSAVLLDIKRPIGPATSDYLVRGLEKAEDRGAELVILRMDTPGGLDTSMREIIRAILASPVPVVSYVAPSGSRAASAGTYISYASHVAAMAPGTNLGAATPVQIGGPGLPQMPRDQDKDKDKDKDKGKGEDGSEETPDTPPKSDGAKPTLSDKAVNDAVAYIRSLAQLRGRNVEWAEKAVLSASTLTAEEARREGVIEVVADNVEDLLAKLDGWEVTIEGQTRRLETTALGIVALEPDWRTELLAIITNPNVAYILMLIGIYGLLFEFYSPGLVGPGVIGAICLLLALYAFHVLPVDYTGLALILLGLALMIAEAFMPSFGVLGIGGIAAFVIGSIMLMDTEVPGFTVAWQLIGSIAFFAGGMLLIMVTMLMRSRRRAVVTGPEEMIDSAGAVLDWAGEEGHVRIHGEVWRARASGPIAQGKRVRVTRIDGLTLEVEPEPKRR
jgi:membrane-bound serine protease (ClpP class)